MGIILRYAFLFLFPLIQFAHEEGVDIPELQDIPKLFGYQGGVEGCRGKLS